MIKSIEIFGLFGMYDYTLDIEKSSEKGVLFITGPNGMGKSTILRLIFAVYKQNIRDIGVVAFDKMVCHFDSCELEFQRNEHYETPDSSLSDVPIRRVVCLKYEYKGKNGSVVESCKWNGDYDDFEKHALGEISNLELLTKSERCVFVADSRMHDNTHGSMLYTPEHLMNVLEDMQTSINRSVGKVGITTSYSPVTENVIEKFIDEINFLETLGLEVPVDKQILLGDESPLKYFMFASVKNMLLECKDKIQRLKLFYSIIQKSRFVDKDFIIDRGRGYRFRLHNKEKKLLRFEELSSGEQHIICQIMTLLFSEERISLVLIDEPELSFHLMWQMQYLKNIREIHKIRECNMFIATHSTQIFGGDFDKTCDLYSQRKKN